MILIIKNVKILIVLGHFELFLAPEYIPKGPLTYFLLPHSSPVSGFSCCYKKFNTPLKYNYQVIKNAWF